MVIAIPLHFITCPTDILSIKIDPLKLTGQDRQVLSVPL